MVSNVLRLHKMWFYCISFFFIAVFFRPVSHFNMTTSDGANNSMNIHVSWPLSLQDADYVVTIADPLIDAVPNCTGTETQSHCFVVRNTVSATQCSYSIALKFSTKLIAVFCHFCYTSLFTRSHYQYTTNFEVLKISNTSM